MLKKSLLICASAALLFSGCGGGESARSPRVKYHNVFLASPVVRGGGATSVYPARVEEARSIAVGFKTGGQIERLFVKDGDHVAQGQLLAILDTVDYALNVKQLREQYQMLKAETERQAKLHATRNISDNDFEKATSALRQLALQLKLSENKLDYCRLYAPVSGVIVQKNHERAEMVNAGTPVFELMDNNSLQVVVDLPLHGYANSDRFTSFEGETSIDPGKSFPLRMLSLTPRADNNQLYQMKLGVVPGSKVKLTPGMNVKVTVTDSAADGSDPTIAVPLSSLFDLDGKACVWLFNPADSTVKATPVVTHGSGENGLIEVTGDISATSQIVRAGVHALTDGEQVRPIDEHSSTNAGQML